MGGKKKFLLSWSLFSCCFFAIFPLVTLFFRSPPKVRHTNPSPIHPQIHPHKAVLHPPNICVARACGELFSSFLFHFFVHEYSRNDSELWESPYVRRHITPTFPSFLFFPIVFLSYWLRKERCKIAQVGVAKNDVNKNYSRHILTSCK